MENQHNIFRHDLHGLQNRLTREYFWLHTVSSKVENTHFRPKNFVH